MTVRSGRPRRYIKPELKDKLRKRDGYTCRLCLTHANDLDHQLQVHHIRPVEIGGRDRFNNLITLCNLCHRVVHKDIPKWVDPMREYVSLLNSTGSYYTFEEIERGKYEKD